jgi:RsiW-degrading membrane proteinase PrsW (M82 family)
MDNISLTIVLTLLPSVLLFLYIYTHDEHPEPKWLITKIGIFGALSFIPVIIVALSFEKAVGLPDAGVFPMENGFFKAFFLAAIPEEFFKLLTVLIFVYKKPAFDEPYDGIIYGAVASLGFATLENILYVSGGGFAVAVKRALTAVPMHAFCGVVMGYYIGRAKFTPKNKSNKKFWIMALLIPILIHGLYDAFLFWGVNAQRTEIVLLFLIPLVVVIVLGVLMIRSLERNNLKYLSEYHEIPQEQLEKFIPKGALSEEILPQLVLFLKQTANSGKWTIPQGELPLQFAGFIDENDKPPIVLTSQNRRSRGFLGLLFAITGALIISFASLMAIGILGSFNKANNVLIPEIGGAIVFIGFVLINGIMLFLKGIRRNRVAQVRSLGAQFLLFIGFLWNIFMLAAFMGSLKKYKLGEEDFPSTILIFFAVGFVIWVIGYFKKGKKVELNEEKPKKV